jgi:hypothetical protein
LARIVSLLTGDLSMLTHVLSTGSDARNALRSRDFKSRPRSASPRCASPTGVGSVALLLELAPICYRYLASGELCGGRSALQC